ncbi:MAG: hypothetical protein ACYCSR_12685 [Thiomonas sp.]
MVAPALRASTTPRMADSAGTASPVAPPGEDAEVLVETTARLEQEPFDALPSPCADAVRADMVQRSLLAASRFERELAALEQLILVPSARKP